MSDSGELIIEKFLPETEPGIVTPIRVVRAKTFTGKSPAIVYLRNQFGEQDSRALFLSVAKAGKLAVEVDVRGFGETWAPRSVRETSADYFEPRDGVDADFVYGANFLGRPLLGMRVRDALKALAFVRSRPDVDPGRISIAGRGQAGVIALLTALLDGNVSAAAAEGIPVSYGALALAETYVQPSSLLLQGALHDFDLGDIFAALAPRPLLVLNAQDPLGRKMYSPEAETALKPVQEAYRSARVPTAFDVRTAALESETLETFTRWLAEH